MSLQDRANEIAQKIQAQADANEAAGGACDFCDKRNPPFIMFVFGDDVIAEHSLLDEDTLETAKIVENLDRRWAACGGCAPIVRQNDPVKLADAMCELRRGKYSSNVLALVRSELIELYTQLYSLGYIERPDE